MKHRTVLSKDHAVLVLTCERDVAAAEASITSCTFMGVRKTAVMVRGENSVLKMANSKLRRQLPKSNRAAPSSVFVDKSDFVGVAVMEKSDAQLRDIEMRDLLRCVSLHNTSNSMKV